MKKKHFFPYSSLGYIVLEKSKATLKNPQVMISSIWSSVNSFHCMYISIFWRPTRMSAYSKVCRNIYGEEKSEREKNGARVDERVRAPATFTIHIHTQIIEDDEIQSGNHKSASTIFFTQPPLNWLKFFNFLFLFFSRSIHICNKLLWFFVGKMNIFCGIFFRLLKCSMPISNVMIMTNLPAKRSQVLENIMFRQCFSIE